MPETTSPTPEASPAPALSLDTMRVDVADLLGEDPASIGDEENLADRGLDSIRLMTLTERWRAAGAEVSFLDLVETPTLRQWWDRVRG